MIDSKQIASFLGLKLNGENIPIKDFSQLSDLRPGVVVFAKRYNEKHVADQQSGVMS